MLYDPKWEKKTKADPFTLWAFIAWLEKQPADQKYDYLDCFGACLYAQYMQSVGVSWEDAGASSLYRNGDKHKAFREMAIYPVAARAPWTYGAALERARAALTQHKGTET